MLQGRSVTWGPQVFLGDAAISCTYTGPNEINYVQAAHSILIHLTPDAGWQLAVDSDRKSSGIVAPGAIDVAPANSQVSGKWTGRMYGLRIDIDQARLERLASVELGSAEFELQPPEFGFVDKHLHTLALWTLKELNDGDSFSTETLDALVTLSYVHVLRNYSSLAGRPSPTGGLSPKVLRKVKDFIHANRTRSLTIEELASVALLSPTHFLRAFRQSTGQSPHQFVLAARLAHARELILTGDAPLSSIAMSAGFSSHSHMTAQMKRAWGITPSEMRRKR